MFEHIFKCIKITKKRRSRVEGRGRRGGKGEGKEEAGRAEQSRIMTEQWKRDINDLSLILHSLCKTKHVYHLGCLVLIPIPEPDAL